MGSASVVADNVEDETKGEEYYSEDQEVQSLSQVHDRFDHAFEKLEFVLTHHN